MAQSGCMKDRGKDATMLFIDLRLDPIHLQQELNPNE